LKKTTAYSARHAYGEDYRDDTDEESFIDDEMREKIANATPNTRRSLKSQADIERTGKIGPAKTFFTLIKGFVAAGILFLPRGWASGGWLFSTIALILSCCLTTVASLKLVEIRRKYKLSFSEIGFKAYGKAGKIAVDFFLWFTQTIFVCAYVTFIVDSVNNILHFQFDINPINKWILGVVCFAIYMPLVLIRKIEKFAFFHVFADIAIMIGIITIVVFGFLELKKNDWKFSDDTQMINNKTFLSFIGLSAYTFEGIGIILPVMETTSRPDLYPKIVTSVIISITVAYVIFGNFNYFVYGYTTLHEYPMITSVLPNGNIFVSLVEVIWIINLILTYPLVIHPANMVLESYIYPGWPKSRKRTWAKNFTRALLVAFTVVLAVALLSTLDRLESINGAFACIPLAFMLPCLFHYKLIAVTNRDKNIDLAIVGLSLILQIVCTVITFVFWND